LQNPTITNAGTNASGSYSVTATVNGCSGPAGTASVTVNSIPLAPAVSSNGPIMCRFNIKSYRINYSGGILFMVWSKWIYIIITKPVINNVTAANAGSYAVTVTVAQCTSAAASIL
jgi:hypothetical protein